jgi:large subunit ribosomal protein L18
MVKKYLEKQEKLVNKLKLFRIMKKKIKKLFLQIKKRSFKKIIGTPQKPRLSVFRSHKHIYAQLIDDKNKQTLAFSSTLIKEIKEKSENITPKESAFLVGQSLAQKGLLKEITYVVFDRGNRPYHGRIQQVAEGAREQGLIF